MWPNRFPYYRYFQSTILVASQYFRTSDKDTVILCAVGKLLTRHTGSLIFESIWILQVDRALIIYYCHKPPLAWMGGKSCCIHYLPVLFADCYAENYRILIYFPLKNIKENWYEYFIVQYLCQSHFYLRYCAILKGKTVQLVICPRRPYKTTTIHSFYTSSFRSKNIKQFSGF